MEALTSRRADREVKRKDWDDSPAVAVEGLPVGPSSRGGLPPCVMADKRRKTSPCPEPPPIWMRDPDWLYLPHLQVHSTHHRRPELARELHHTSEGQMEGRAPKRARAEGEDQVLASQSASSSTTLAWNSPLATAVGGHPPAIAKRPLEESAPPSSSSSSALGLRTSATRTTRRRTESVGDGPGVQEGPEVPLRPFGRRYISMQGDPIDTYESLGHRLCITGSLVWCAKCGRYAARRLGKALKSHCTGRAEGVYASRLERLRNGQHPITGAAIGID